MQCGCDLTARKQSSHMKYERTHLMLCKSHQRNKPSDWPTLLLPRQQQKNFNLCRWQETVLFLESSKSACFLQEFSDSVFVVGLKNVKLSPANVYVLFCLCLTQLLKVFILCFVSLSVTSHQQEDNNSAAC